MYFLIFKKIALKNLEILCEKIWEKYRGKYHMIRDTVKNPRNQKLGITISEIEPDCEKIFVFFSQIAPRNGETEMNKCLIDIQVTLKFFFSLNTNV